MQSMEYLSTLIEECTLHDRTKALVMTFLELRAEVGKPWTSAGAIRFGLWLKKTVYTLLKRWVEWGLVQRRITATGAYQYRIGKAGKRFLLDLDEWWPFRFDRTGRRGVTRDILRQYVAQKAGLLIVWGVPSSKFGTYKEYGWFVAPFISENDFRVYRAREGNDYTVVSIKKSMPVTYIFRGVDRAYTATKCISALGFGIGYRCGDAAVRANVGLIWPEKH